MSSRQPNPRVFISYSHDSLEHSNQVLEFAWALRSNGIDVELDQFHNEEIVDWPRWCNDQISRDHSDFVLCVCTAEYRRRIEGHVPPEKGKGVYWEGSLLDDYIYDEKGNCRVIAVLLNDEPETSIVSFLRGWTHCRVRGFALDDAGYEHLIRILTKQSKVEKNPLGPVPVLPPASAPSRTGFQADISRIVKYAPAELIGRESETKLLSDAWKQVIGGEKKRPHVLTFVALGGEGKTALVSKWAADLAHEDWPGCNAVFAWSFYSQGTREQMAASSDSFLAAALAFFGDAAMAESAAGAFDKGRRLGQLVGGQRALLILDGVEPLQYAPTSPTPGELKDQGLAALLKGLAATSHGLCVVTTRYALPDLRNWWQTTAPSHDLHRLPTAAGVKLLRTLGVKTGSQAEFEKLVEDVDGHALTLQVLGQFLARAHHGDIRRRDRIDFQKANEKIQDGHAFRAMDAYVKWLENGGDEARRELALLSLLGLFDRPATADCVDALRRPPAIPGLSEPLVSLAEEDWEFSLSVLSDAKLVTVHRAHRSGDVLALDSHPLLREYFARRLCKRQPEAWRAAHERLYEHLCATKEGDQPTLEDLQPLYQAVAHGCLADLHREVYREVYLRRINRGKEQYVVYKLGAIGSDLGAVACFFESPWSRLFAEIAEADQAWMLNQAAYCLRALGRLIEAIDPMRAGLELRVKQERWKNAAIVAGNLSELELTLGEVVKAERDAAQSVTYADLGVDWEQRMIMRTTHADALHQAERRAEAEALFREAEHMQAERRPDSPLLSSLQGFQYCEVLLVVPERAAWRKFMGNASVMSGVPGSGTTLSESCRAVSQRADYALKIAEGNHWLLDIALDHLTLGRAGLYAAILEGSLSTSCRTALDSAVAGLRRSGQLNHLPSGLITHAWLRFLEGALTGAESAQSDLDEAWEIAERGPMPLFLADIQLHRARLFRDRDALAEARRLIEKHGYWRRKEELEDAEAALGESAKGSSA